ncbi:hypothetical protein [Gryllotalpicola koreensis]|uniref:Uncharacterized protein n=1 Tax=Gryllotalpicola koreensis TaxID=993086 RepID=A0ABP7ZUT7_9MICO
MNRTRIIALGVIALLIVAAAVVIPVSIHVRHKHQLDALYKDCVVLVEARHKGDIDAVVAGAHACHDRAYGN